MAGLTLRENWDARSLVRSFRPCLAREHLVRTSLIAAVVGTWLTLFNHVDVVLGTAMDPMLAAKVGLNYLTPFVVANLGLLSRQRGTGEDR